MSHAVAIIAAVVIVAVAVAGVGGMTVVALLDRAVMRKRVEDRGDADG